MLSTLLERVLQGIDDAASTPVLKAQVEMLKTAVEELEKENIKLQSEVDRLRKIEIEFEKSNQFIDLDGIVKIKLDKDGNRTQSFYCPQCHTRLLMPEDFKTHIISVIEQNGVTMCQNCHYHTSLTKLRNAIAEWDANHMSL